MIALRLVLLPFVLLIFLAAAAYTADTNQNETPFTIYMAVWRGCEEACQGFQDYFREESIEVNFLIRDAKRSKANLSMFVHEAKQLKVDLVLTWGTSVTLGMVGTH